MVWAVFLVSVVLAISVAYAFHFLYNLVAFWLLDYSGRHAHLRRGARRSSPGFIIPVRFFPDWLQTVAYVTPFPSMVQLPIDVFVGYTTGAELVATLAMQLGWAAVLFCRLLCRVPAGNAKAGRAGWLSP